MTYRDYVALERQHDYRTETRHSTLYTPHVTLYTPHFTLHTPLQSTLYTVHHCTLYTWHSPHFRLYTLHSTLHTPHLTLLTLHCTLHTLHFTLHPLHSPFTLDTLHSTIYEDSENCWVTNSPTAWEADTHTECLSHTQRMSEFTLCGCIRSCCNPLIWISARNHQLIDADCRIIFDDHRPNRQHDQVHTTRRFSVDGCMTCMIAIHFDLTFSSFWLVIWKLSAVHYRCLPCWLRQVTVILRGNAEVVVGVALTSKVFCISLTFLSFLFWSLIILYNTDIFRSLLSVSSSSHRHDPPFMNHNPSRIQFHPPSIPCPCSALQKDFSRQWCLACPTAQLISVIQLWSIMIDMLIYVNWC